MLFRSLGLVGFGGIAVEVARLARAFGMRVIAWTRHAAADRVGAKWVEFVELSTLMSTSDIVSVHVALTPQTQNLLTAELLGQLKDDAIFVNTARGEIIDESALVELLRAQRIRGAALDVFVDEPLSPDHVLRQFDNVVLTPHTAYNTPEASARILDIALDNVLAYFSGDPMNVVN